MVTASFEKAEQKALELLSEFEIDEPLIPVFEIAERKGLNVVILDMPGKLIKVSGFLDPKSKTIYVNSDDPPNRQLFTTAHELGHYILNHEPEQYGVLPRFATPIDKEPVEQEANFFAATLLVPKNILLETMKKYDLSITDLDLLSDMFGVSEDVIKYRLKTLGLWK